VSRRALLAVLAALAAAPAPAQAVQSTHLPVRSHDGAVLDGWVHLPDGTSATSRVPIVLVISPYWGNLTPSAADIDRATTEYSDPLRKTGIALRSLVDRGYGVALYNMRGTGASGGCMDIFGPDEQRDSKVLVEAMADAPFSTGRVATVGKSIPGFAALAAAATQARGLRAVIASSPVTDAYAITFTPQGAQHVNGEPNHPSRQALAPAPPVDTNPASAGGTAQSIATGSPGAVAGSVCPNAAEQLRNGLLGRTLGSHDERYWRDRRLLEALSRASTPILLTSGFHDDLIWNFQEADWWEALRGGPRRLVLSRDKHLWPTRAGFDGEVLAWLDHFLRDGPAPPSLGRVDFQDRSGRWHETSSWPPAGTHDELLLFSGEGLSDDPGGERRTFRAVRDVVSTSGVDDSFRSGDEPTICPTSAPGTSLSWLGAPVAERTLIAGHPYAVLSLASDLPAGVVEVSLYAQPAATCDARGVRFLGLGTADLRFHTGSWAARPFPVALPTTVRVDLPSMAEHLLPGERLLVVVNGGETPVPDPHVPQLTLHPGSRVTVPVAEGTFGGRRRPAIDPPRPHALGR
jgi:putative CocE/NonD family hydrolase